MDHRDHKFVKLQVPGDFEIPSFYSSASAHYRALALRLGADAVTYIQKKALDVVRQETHAEAVKQATEEFEAQLQEATATATTTAAKLRAQAQRAEEALRAANLRVEALEAVAAQSRTQAAREARESLAELLAAKDKQIEQLQATLERQMEALGGKLEGLTASMTKTMSSSKDKGSYGEGVIDTLLRRAFDCDVHQVAKDRETADIRMTRATGAAYFWEVKNYTRMVSREEVLKLKRDLALHPDVKGGVMVSLRQGIVDHTRGGDIDLEFLEDGRFVLYLSHFLSREDPVFYLQTLRPFLDTIEGLTKPVREDTEAVRALEAKALLITNLLRSHSSGVTKHKNALVGHKRRTDAMFTEFQGYVMEAEAQLATLLRVAVGGDAAAAEVQAEADTLLSPFLFRGERLTDFAEDKTRDFVKWLLGVAEAREGTQVELKELLERAKGAGYGEKFVRGLREELFQESAWAKGSRYLLGLRWREGAAVLEVPQPA